MSRIINLLLDSTGLYIAKDCITDARHYRDCIVNKSTVTFIRLGINWRWESVRRTERCRWTGQTPDGPTRHAEVHDDLEECGGERWSVIFKPSSILNRRIYLGGSHRTSGECYTPILKPMLNISPRARRGWINVSYINALLSRAR